MDYARAIDAHLLTGRIALAAGRRDGGCPLICVPPRTPGTGPAAHRAVGWLAQATWAEAEQRWRGMLAA
jgi:hypothetical protein